ncbi:MAG: hypothetical protein ACRD3D_05845 [Terriglobia bacterium]
MKRCLFVFVVFGALLALACGFEIAVLFSAKVEQVAFVLVPPIFMVSALIGLSTYRSLG